MFDLDCESPTDEQEPLTPFDTPPGRQEAVAPTAPRPIATDDTGPMREVAEAFIEALTGSNNTRVTFQTFPDHDGAKGTPPRLLHGTLHDHWRTLVALSELGHGIFVMVNEGDLEGRKAPNVRALRALFLDDDNAKLLTADGHLSESLARLPPSFVVQTKHGGHFYFRLNPGEPLDRFTKAQSHLATHFGTDSKVKDLPRVLRVPGFFHRKDPTDPFMVKLVQVDSSRVYSIDDVLAAYPLKEDRALDDDEPPKPSAKPTIESRIEKARKFLAAQPPAIQGQSGDQHTFQTCCALVLGFDLPDEDALDLAMDDWVSRCQPPWSRDEMCAKLANARKYGTEAVGARLLSASKEGSYKHFGNAAMLKHCVPVLNERFTLLRAADGTERVFSVNANRETTLLIEDKPLEQAVHDALKAKFGAIPPERVLKNATRLWRRECVPLKEEPAPFCFKGDDRLCFKRFDWMPAPGAHPAWDEFLSRLSDAPAFMAFVWSCFEPANRSRQYVWLRGEGQDGKSQVLSAIKNVFGCAAAGLTNAQLQTGRQFLYSALYGKRVVIFADCKNAKFGMTEFVRNSTSGDPVSVEFKNQTPFMHCFLLKLFVGSNSKPEFTGQIADMSRAIYVEVEASQTKDDPTWPTRLEEEMPSFLWDCQQAYREHCPKGGDIKLGARSLELKEEASIGFEERWADIFDANFRAVSNAKTPAGNVSARLRSCGVSSNQDVSEFKQWVERVHGVKYRPSRNGRFYEGLEVIDPFAGALG